MTHVALRRVTVLGLAAVATVALVYGIGRWQASQRLERGLRLLSEGDYAAAARALLRAVAVRPRDARAHYYLALAYSRIGLQQGALRQLQEAIRLAPNEAEFYEGLGQVYREADDRASALGQFEEAVRRDPRGLRYRIALAGTLLDQGRVREALQALREASRLKPDSAEVHLLLAEALRRAGDRPGMQGEYRHALRLASSTPLGELARQALHCEAWQMGSGLGETK